MENIKMSCEELKENGRNEEERINFLNKEFQKMNSIKWIKEEYRRIYPGENFKEDLKKIEKAGVKYQIKDIEKHGNYIIYSNLKEEFTEKIIQMIIKELEKHGIKYIKQEKEREEIYLPEYDKYIELETGLFKGSLYRKDLIKRIGEKDKDKIIITALNQEEKKKYKRSLVIQAWNTQAVILTIPESIKYLEKVKNK